MTGWPWPLDGVQGWFEGLVNSITQALAPVIQNVIDTIEPVIRDVAFVVWGIMPEPFRNALLFLGELAGQAWSALWAFVRDPIGSIQAGLSWVSDMANIAFTWLGAKLDEAIGWVVDSVKGWAVWISDRANESFTWLGDHVSGGLNFLRENIGAGLASITTTITNAFDGAVSSFASWITNAMAAVAGALGSALQGLISWLSTEIPKAVSVVAEFAKAHIVDPIVGALQWVFGRLTDIVHGLISTVENLFAHHSPITPEQALPIGIGVVSAAIGAGALATGLADVLSTKLVGTGLDLKALGGYITAVINPSMFSGAVLGVIVGVGIKQPLTQFYNRSFRPSIPSIDEAQQMLWRGKINMDQFRDIVARSGYGAPYEDGFVELTKQLPGPGDLIRFVVREVIPPAVFDKFMVMQGFSVEIAGWFWEAHWVLPGRAEIIDAFHRGVITSAERDTYLVLHDFSPEPRPGISKSDQKIVAALAKLLIPRVDLRRGYRIGRLTREDLDERYGWLGYEEDTEIMTDIQVGLAFEAERNKLRDNARADLVKGYITEATLRADLTALNYGADAIEYFVADALADRKRKLNDKLLDVYEDAYLKDQKTFEELQQDAATVIVDLNALDVFLTAAWIRKFKKPKGEEAG